MTRIVDGACIFLNRAGWPGGPGCALHAAALRRGEPITEWKPDVCWQVPIRRQDDTDQNGHVTSTIREWKRRDWGPGGDEFAWWCTADTEPADAFVGDRPVWQACRDELIALTSPAVYELLVEHLREREEAGWVPLPHPALKARAGAPT